MISRLERVALPVAALTWLYLISSNAHNLGGDFFTVWSGPHGLLHHEAIYPTTDNPTGYSARDQPYYVHPPSAPVALFPLGLFPQRIAGAAFVIVSGLVFLTGLYRLAVRTPIPWLIVLAAGLSLPVTDAIGLGNSDLLCAGLIALALTMQIRYRAAPLGIALAVKPTMWPILVLFGLDALLALALAVICALLGLVLIQDVGRFFDHVVPYLAHGQKAVATVRASLTDLAVATGLPRFPVSVSCGLVLLTLIAYIAIRVPAERRLALAPLVVLAALLLSSYSYVPYGVYLVAVLPLLRPSQAQLPLLGVALYLIGSPDVWSTGGLPHQLNTLLNFRVLLGMVLLTPIAVCALPRPARLTRRRP